MSALLHLIGLPRHSLTSDPSLQ